MSAATFDLGAALDAASQAGRVFVEHAPIVAERVWLSADPVVARAVEHMISDSSAEIDRNVRKFGASREQARAICRAYCDAIEAATTDRKRRRAN